MSLKLLNKLNQRQFTPRSSLLGFTLVELMVTMVIAAILMSVAVASYSTYKYKTNLANLLNYINSVITPRETEYFEQTGKFTANTTSDGWNDGNSNFTEAYQAAGDTLSGSFAFSESQTTCPTQQNYNPGGPCERKLIAYKFARSGIDEWLQILYLASPTSNNVTIRCGYAFNPSDSTGKIKQMLPASCQNKFVSIASFYLE